MSSDKTFDTKNLTPVEHFLVGGSSRPGLNSPLPDEVYTENPQKPVFLIEHGDEVGPGLIGSVNEERAGIGTYGGYATTLMFDLEGAVDARFRLELVDETGKAPDRVKLAYVKYADGREIKDPNVLDGIGYSSVGMKELQKEFPFMRENGGEEDISRR